MSYSVNCNLTLKISNANLTTELFRADGGGCRWSVTDQAAALSRWKWEHVLWPTSTLFCRTEVQLGGLVRGPEAQSFKAIHSPHFLYLLYAHLPSFLHLSSLFLLVPSFPFHPPSSSSTSSQFVSPTRVTRRLAVSHTHTHTTSSARHKRSQWGKASGVNARLPVSLPCTDQLVDPCSLTEWRRKYGPHSNTNTQTHTASHSLERRRNCPNPLISSFL